MLIRPAVPADAPALLAIYAPYVTDTAVTFEYQPPTEKEFARRMADTMQKYPYLVAEEEGRPLGYAYAGPLKARQAYDWSAETTIYLRQDARGKGWGPALYGALEQALRQMGICNLYACIAYAEKEDEYLTQASPHFHARMGYRACGTFRRCAWKFGRWYDMIWMEKWIGDHDRAPAPAAWRTPQ
ncbi:MAG: N-acetyltransferase [Clostridia bacterium]|nr:N-acetyltransferase [Clostridia bacterium]